MAEEDVEALLRKIKGLEEKLEKKDSKDTKDTKDISMRIVGNVPG